ncbi:MAG: GNAT family N-acetyltransferase [Betaproteobacteria bacterium]|nr:GNAT family N-acetyltransferase [Betaproteobacteria bacterium]
MDFTLEPCDTPDTPGWLALRTALWPDTPEHEHIEEMAAFAARPERYFQQLARNTEGEAIGLIEASIRMDYVNGTESSPVGYLEGIFVTPEARRHGVARSLVESAMVWATQRGCQEFASDALWDNTLSQTVHRALGFEETDRVVFFLRRIDRPSR